MKTMKTAMKIMKHGGCFVFSSKRWVIDDFDMENQDFRGFV